MWATGGAVIVAIAAGWFFILRENALSYTRAVDGALERSHTRAVILREFVDSTFSGISLALQSVDVRPDVAGVVLPQDRRVVPEILRRTARVLPVFLALGVTDVNGNIIFSMRDDDQKAPYASVADRAYFSWHRSHRSPNLLVTAPIKIRFLGQWAIPISMRVEDEAGRFTGVIIGSVRPAYFRTIMRASAVDDAAIALRDGSVLVHESMRSANGAGEKDGPTENLDTRNEFFRRWQQETAGTYSGSSPFGGAAQAASYSSLRSVDAAVYVGIDLDKELASVRAETRARTTVGAAFTILALLLAAAVMFDMRRSEQAAEDLRIARDDAHRARDLAEAARKRAEEADLNKSNFLAHTSHELRTPLNAIIGFAEIITKEALGPLGEKRYQEYSGYIHQSGEQLLGVVNNILDLAQATSGRWELRRDRFAFVEVLDDVWRIIAPLAAARSVTLIRQVAPDLPDLVTERRVVRQILLNLLNNAVKFTLAGGRVQISARLNDHGGLAIRIADTGVGIDAKVLEYVARPYSGLTHMLARQPGTSGLGLPLCRIFAELLGGSLTLSSKVGEGTAVDVVLPPDCLVPAGADTEPSRPVLERQPQRV